MTSVAPRNHPRSDEVNPFLVSFARSGASPIGLMDSTTALVTRLTIQTGSSLAPTVPDEQAIPVNYPGIDPLVTCSPTSSIAPSCEERFLSRPTEMRASTSSRKILDSRRLEESAISRKDNAASGPRRCAQTICGQRRVRAWLGQKPLVVFGDV